jgi:hypothetical protein
LTSILVKRSAGKERSREIAHYGGSKSAEGTVRLWVGVEKERQVNRKKRKQRERTKSIDINK